MEEAHRSLKRNLKRIMLFTAALLLIGTALPAQTAPQRQVFAATSSPSDAVAVIRANALLEELVRNDELIVVSAQPDRQLPGRVHEYFAQVHRGVPVRGAGLARQSADGMPVSVFGTTFADIDIDTVPRLDAEAGLARMEELAGAARATTKPAELVIVPTMLGELVLAWSAPLRDYRTWFVDAHRGELVHRIDHFFTETAVGSGPGITGALQKMSTWSADGGYEARDRLRPAEIVTLDAGGDPNQIWVVAYYPDYAWLPMVSWDHDNAWANPAVVDGHANVGLAYDYLFKNQNWRGLDGKDGAIYSLVNLGVDNAFFLSAPDGPEGRGFLGFGETSDEVPFVPLDVVGHEFMHGVMDTALTERTGQGSLFGSHDVILGPSTISVGGEVIRCGDFHSTHLTSSGEVNDYYVCFDEDGNRTTSSSGRFGLFLEHGGAISEAFADIIGTAVEFSTHPPGEGALRADYRLGEDAGVVDGRRMDQPGSQLIGGFPYPDAMGKAFRFVVVSLTDEFVKYTHFGMQGDQAFSVRRLASADGFRGTHWNSTILSHAAYLAIEGGQHSSGQTVEGVGVANRLQIEQAFFRGLVDLAPSRATFPIMGRVVRQAAMDLHGAGSAAFTAIDQALTAVGL